MGLKVNFPHWQLTHIRAIHTDPESARLDLYPTDDAGDYAAEGATTVREPPLVGSVAWL